MAPTHPLNASSAPPKANTTEPYPTTPRRRTIMAKREPLIRWEPFVAAHRTMATRRTEYLAAGRKRSIRLERVVLNELDRHAAMYLYANNTDARIAFAAVAKRHMAKLAANKSIQLFWVTLIPKQYVVPEDQAAAFEPMWLQKWAQQELWGLNYVGMVEAALYTNANALRGGHRRMVSWHVHLIAWGADEACVQEITNDINQRYAAFLPGVEPAYAVPVTAEGAIGKVLYMLKAPQSEHRVWPIRARDIDPDTGEVFERHTGRFKQKKRALRPGDLIRMCKVLADKYLDRLAFAGGEGVPILDAIRGDALRPLRQHEAQETARRTSSGHQDRGHRLPRY